MNISFSKTIEQMRLYNKTVTRRYGWKNLYPAQILTAVEKAQGLKLGERVKPIHEIQVLASRWERADRLITDLEYGEREVILEGFPDMTPKEFMDMLCHFNKKLPHEEVNRIEFRHLFRQRVNEITINGETFILEPTKWEYQKDGTLAGLFENDPANLNQMLLDTIRFEIT